MVTMSSIILETTTISKVTSNYNITSLQRSCAGTSSTKHSCAVQIPIRL